MLQFLYQDRPTEGRLSAQAEENCVQTKRIVVRQNNIDISGRKNCSELRLFATGLRQLATRVIYRNLR